LTLVVAPILPSQAGDWPSGWWVGDAGPRAYCALRHAAALMQIKRLGDVLGGSPIRPHAVTIHDR
jgi:hypothetical protein